MKRTEVVTPSETLVETVRALAERAEHIYSGPDAQALARDLRTLAAALTSETRERGERQ